MAVIPVSMGSLAIASAPDVLETIGVGSCVAIMMYDPQTKIGGLAHAMLPSMEKSGNKTPACHRFVDCAIDTMLEEMQKRGARPERCIAKLAGGAHMFDGSEEDTQCIGLKNTEQARRYIRSRGIPVACEETGGSAGRNVRFDLTNGVCSVETKM